MFAKAQCLIARNLLGRNTSLSYGALITGHALSQTAQPGQEFTLEVASTFPSITDLNNVVHKKC